jgi:hypothetical protein
LRLLLPDNECFFDPRVANAGETPHAEYAEPDEELEAK